MVSKMTFGPNSAFSNFWTCRVHFRQFERVFVKSCVRTKFVHAVFEPWLIGRLNEHAQTGPPYPGEKWRKIVRMPSIYNIWSIFVRNNKQTQLKVATRWTIAINSQRHFENFNLRFLRNLQKFILVFNSTETFCSTIRSCEMVNFPNRNELKCVITVDGTILN